jgi:phage tail-like protein
LPAVFGEEPTGADFTDRFLALFDTTMRSIEGPLDRLASFFDPASAPAERDPKTGADFLGWLASWIGVTLERHWPDATRRRLLKESGRLFAIRGTRRALWRQLVLLLDMEPERPDGICCPDDRPHERCHAAPRNCAPEAAAPCAWQPPPLILEHQRLRRWLFVGAGRLGDQARLWGKRIANRTQLDEGARLGGTQLVTSQDPDRDPFHYYAHKFTVFLPARYGKCAAHRRALANLLRAGSPAHTRYDVEYVEPRFRIGVQSMLGFDAVVARLPQGVTLNETPLGRASILTSPPHEAGGPSFEIGESRIGTTTRLN